MYPEKSSHDRQPVANPPGFIGKGIVFLISERAQGPVADIHAVAVPLNSVPGAAYCR